MALVELKNISKIYQMDKVRVKAVDNASFCIEQGDFCAISGPSGSGKSTLLNIIGLTDIPSSGSVILNDIDVYKDIDLTKTKTIPLKLDSHLTDLRRQQLGFIFQTFNLIPVLNVYENICMPLEIGTSPAKDTMSKKELAEWADFLIETVGLTEWKKHKPSELSGGQRQRVAIARLMLKPSEIILADEPTGNLNYAIGRKVMEELIRNAKGKTLICVTHDDRLAELFDEVIDMNTVASAVEGGNDHV